ncbi:MAG: AraC family transcriptional regulator [Acidobacteriota bacterium]|nr:AraC family transcriptional regulator [Acidobacteriota bacterium]
MEKEKGLAQLVRDLTISSGLYQTEIPGLWLSNFSAVDPPRHTIDFAVFCIVAQGAIKIMLPREIVTHGPGDYLVSAFDLPTIAQIVGASQDRPYLGVTLRLKFDDMDELVLAMDRPHVHSQDGRALFFGKLDTGMASAVYRLVELLTTPEDIPILAPLIRREIFYRLLSSSHGTVLRNMLTKNGQIRRISQVVEWMKKNYTKPFTIEDLARRANMSVASLHSWFKSVTAETPLQFQKRLRLQEARRQLLHGGATATIASERVGYESASHFSRDYSRFFGEPPHRDIERMRNTSAGVGSISKVLPARKTELLDRSESQKGTKSGKVKAPMKRKLPRGK